MVLLRGLLLSDFTTKILHTLLYSSMYATCPFRIIISHKRRLSILLLTNSTLLTAASLPLSIKNSCA
jgi:hypothetical protein